MRNLVTIRTVESVHPIPDAEFIEKIVLDGWAVVTQKGNFQVGDKAVYLEIDSCFTSDSILGKSLPIEKAIRVHTEEIGYIESGFRIKTIRLRKQVSQGYALPLKYFEDFETNLEAEDLAKELSVYKYEAPYSGTGSGHANARGSFPTSYCQKTDQERIQNVKHDVYRSYLDETKYEVSVKLDGSSISIGRVQLEDCIEDYICSRNLALKLDQEVDTSHFLLAGRPILEKLKEFDYMNLFLQGELISPGIQANFEGVLTPQVHIFSIFDTVSFKYLNPLQTKVLVENLGLNYVPTLAIGTTLKELFGDDIKNANELLEKLLEYADGPSAFKGKFREGVVFKALDNQFSFKAVSNRYLLKTGN